MARKSSRSGLIKRLRALGGTWRAERWGFAYYVYFGEYAGSTWRIQSFSTIVDAERDLYGSEWQIIRDGVDARSVSVLFDAIDPVETVTEMARERRD